MGRNLVIFDDDYNTIEEGRSWTALGSYSQAYGFASITMYSWWQLGEIDACTESATRCSFQSVVSDFGGVTEFRR